MTGSILTPRTREGVRLTLTISAEDSLAVDRLRYEAQLFGLDAVGYVNATDLTTGNLFTIYPSECGLPECVCDAIADPYLLATHSN